MMPSVHGVYGSKQTPFYSLKAGGRGQRCWHMLLIQARERWSSVRSRPAWSAKQVPGQSELHRNPVSKKRREVAIRCVPLPCRRHSNVSPDLKTTPEDAFSASGTVVLRFFQVPLHQSQAETARGDQVSFLSVLFRACGIQQLSL